MTIPLFLSFAMLREIIDIFPHLKKNHPLMLAFSQTPSKQDLLNCLHDYKLARGLHCHLRIDALDFVSRSQVCQKYEQ